MVRCSFKKLLAPALTLLMAAGLLTGALAAPEGGILKQNKNSKGQPVTTYYSNGTAVRHFTGNTTISDPLGHVVVAGSNTHVMNTFIYEAGFTVLDDATSCHTNYEHLRTPFTFQLPETIEVIEAGVFENGGSNRYLQNINFPAGLKRIKSRAFSGCILLSSAELNNGLEIIEPKAFSNCDSLTSVTIPSSVTKMGDGIFASCDSLSSLTFSSGITSIPSSVAENCPSLSSVTIAEGVTEIGGAAFYQSGLSSVSLPGSLTRINGNAFAETNLSSILLGEKLEYIGGSAFKGTQISSVDFPESLQTIDAYAFADTPMQSVVIPEGVRRIGDQAFPAHTVIYGYRGTAAQLYAERWHNTFIPLDDCGIDAEIKEEHVNHGTVKAGTVTEVTSPGISSYINTTLTLRSDNDEFHDIVLTVTLPDGFSFEYNKLVTKLELPRKYGVSKDREATVDLPLIYPIYLDDLDKDDMYELTVDIQALDSVDAAVSGQKTCGFFDPDEVTRTAEYNGKELRGITYEFDLDSATGSGASYNKETAELAALLADGAYKGNKDNEFLSELGFSLFNGGSWGDFNIKNCAYYMARKRIIENGEIKNLIYVMCRGTAGSGSEWLGNFQVGDGDNHTGFLTASETVLRHVEQYCSILKGAPENTIFLVTGHSKAAAAANNLGNLLNKSGLANKENISVYTFATPTVSRSITTEAAALAGNENIFNFVHYQDAIRNAPSMRYYGRYGHTTIFGYGEPAPRTLSANFGYGTYACLGDEENYTVMEILNGVMNAVDPGGLLSGELLAGHVLPAAISILAYMDEMPELTSLRFPYFEQYILDTVGALTASHIAADASSAHSMVEYYKAVRNGASGTSFETIRTRTEAAWEYYQTHIAPTSADYQKLLINAGILVMHRFKCPIDVYVDDLNGNTVLSMENGDVVNHTQDIAAYYDGDAKVLVLLKGQAQNYTIRLVGYDDGTVTHALSPLGVGGVQRVQIQYDIPVRKGETLTLPADGYLTDETAYTLATDPAEVTRILLELENLPYTPPDIPVILPDTEPLPQPEPTPEPAPKPTPEPEPTPSPTPSPEPTPAPSESPSPTPSVKPSSKPEEKPGSGEENEPMWEEDSSLSGSTIVIIAASVVLIAAAAVIFFSLKKRR